MTARPIPPPAQAKECQQCRKPTWKKTSECVWCGYDRWAVPFRVGVVVLQLIIAVFAWRLI